jgi:hypothetical protein
LGTGVTLSKGCVLGLGVVLPHDSNLEASILVASPMQSMESLDQDDGKLFCLAVTVGFYLFHTKEEPGFMNRCFLMRETGHVHLHEERQYYPYA